MNINLIIISRYGNQSFIDKVKSLNLATPENTNVIYPNSEHYETTLIIPYFKLPSDGSWYNLIIYDWSTTMSSIINNDIQSLYNNLNENFDIVYLGKYLDTCNNYSIKENINMFSLVSGTDPIGFNAALLTTSFSEKIIPYLQNNKFYTLTYAINEYKIQNSIIEYSVSPNLFVFNPLYTSIDLSNSYSVKSEECQGITSQIIPPSDNNLTIFWILIIVFIIALLIWLFINFTSYGQSIEAKRSNNIEIS